MQFLVYIVAFSTLISALEFNVPRATLANDAIELHPQGWTPKPTDPPKFNIELFKRQSTNSLTEIEGPDPICGYQFGSQYGSLGLCYTSTCGFATALDQDGEVFCYDSTTSAPRPSWTSCLAGTLGASCLADSACINNPGIIICTVTTEPYCNAGTFIGLGVEAVWCDSTYYTGGSIIPIYTTYSGQIGRVFRDPTSSNIAPTTTSTTFTSSSTNTLVSPLSSTTFTSSSTNTLVSPLSSTTSTMPSPTPHPKNSTPIGPIVGGVIGGLALVAAIIAGMFLFLRRNRKHQQTTNPPEIQSYSQGNNTYSQQPFDKCPVFAEETFILTEYLPISGNPGQQTNYPQLPGSKYEQPSYNEYPHPQEPPTRPTGKQIGANRVSMVSSISAPRSPAPPMYIPAVPEMTGEMRHYANPIDEHYEMET